LWLPYIDSTREVGLQEGEKRVFLGGFWIAKEKRIQDNSTNSSFGPALAGKTASYYVDG
jgi:hypothetical protein